MESTTEVNDDSPGTIRTLAVARLHETHDLKREITDVFASAAAICMERHHRSPTMWSVRLDDDATSEYEVSWSTPTAVDRRSFANHEEATELGACGVALAAVEAHLGLVTFARAEPRTGIDFYLVAPHEDVPDAISYDIDDPRLIGLEVSGINRDTDATMRSRLRAKVAQIRRGRSPHHAIAGVAGFLRARMESRTAKP